MVRAAILDADVVGDCRATGKQENYRAARLVQHRVERLEPAVARHGGRLVELAGDGVRAEFPSAAQALGAAIEFQQAVADANRGQPEDSAVVFRLGLHLGDASEVGDTAVARRPEQRHHRSTAGRGGIVVSAPLRDAVAGRVRASFAELGGAGLGTVERPIHAYEVGWDPADWPAESAAAATTIVPDQAGRGGRLAFAIVAVALAALVAYLASAPRPPPALALGVPGAQGVDRLLVERRAEAALGRWWQNGAEPDEPDDEPANAANAPPPDAYDGLYTGTTTARADSRVVTFRVKVSNGIGSGTQSRLDCGTAPVALRISPSGEVSGMVLIFGSTCLKTELAIRGRAVAGTLRLHLGGQFLELSPAD